MDESTSNPSGGLTLEQARGQIGDLLSGEPEKKERAAREADRADDEPRRPVNAWIDEDNPVATGEDEESDEPSQDESDEDDEEQSDDRRVDDDEQDDDEVEQPRYRVKVSGEEVEVTLDELLKGYSRTQDYTRKTQETAALRQQAEQTLQAFQARAMQYEQGLQALAAQLQRDSGQEPDWDKLYEENPLEFTYQRAKWEKIKQQQVALAREYQQAQQQRQYAEQQMLASTLEKELTSLVDKIPEYKNPESRTKIQRELREYAANLGFAKEELDSTTDHRAVVALWKAMQYDKIAARKKDIAPRVERVAQPTKANTPAGSSQRNKAMERFKRNPTARNAADAIAALRLV